ncbi:plant regulator RWP-RK family protein [Striga asiatica]|uniref:Plant regulator RWP-RK family protein n=1 Tax=Striga asiatica TaxID=4170 RepID=A0A5A7P841_STRAF|nr:plant regulator RWP-RK family protein [Striga asiatica]
MTSCSPSPPFWSESIDSRHRIRGWQVPSSASTPPQFKHLISVAVCCPLLSVQECYQQAIWPSRSVPKVNKELRTIVSLNSQATLETDIIITSFQTIIGIRILNA